MRELDKGRFSVNANVNKNDKKCSIKAMEVSFMVVHNIIADRDRIFIKLHVVPNRVSHSPEIIGDQMRYLRNKFETKVGE